MTTPPDDHELAVKARLIALIDGPETAAAQPHAVNAAAAIAQPHVPMQPQPDRAAAPGGTWWDALYKAGASDTHDTRPDDRSPDAQPQPGDRRPDRRRIQPWWTGRHVDLTKDTDEDDTEPPTDDDSEEPALDGEDDAETDTDDDTDEGASTRRRISRTRLRTRPAVHSRRPAAAATGAARALVDEPAPRLALVDAYAAVPYRIRWLALHAAAAGAGWRLGIVDWATDTTAWYAAGHWVSPSAWVLYGLGACAIALYRRTRSWAWPAAWAAAIPVSSVVAGVLLYGTGYHP
ncbi:hypothetical protein [Streptomyces sp. NPDC004721]